MGPQAKAKVYYLENDKQFWEISVDGKETRIRTGKRGFKGRTFPPRQHADGGKAAKFAIRNVNAKIMLGFETSDISSPNKKSPVARKSSQKVIKGPPKKRESARKLARQSTMMIVGSSSPLSQNSSGQSTSDVKTAEKPKWRKPHKKQTTIRRLAQKESLRKKALLNSLSSAKRQSTVRSSNKQTREPPSRQNTVKLSSKDSAQPPLLKRRTSNRFTAQRKSLSRPPTLEEQAPFLQKPGSSSTSSSGRSKAPPLLKKRTSSVRRQLF